MITTYIQHNRTGAWIPVINGKEMSLWALGVGELVSWHRNQRRVLGRYPAITMRYW